MEVGETKNIDRRANERAPFLVIEIKGTHSNKIFLAQTENISQGGLFFSSPEKLKIGDRFPIEFVLPDNKTIVSCTSEVVWKKHYGQSGLNSEGIGIRFIDLEPDQKKILGDWIDREEEKEKEQL